MGDNYRHFPRFRAFEIGKNRTDIMNIRIVSLTGVKCGEPCDLDAIRTQYSIGGREAMEQQYKFKYLLDLDGNSFSGRYLGLLRTGSLVFKVRTPRIWLTWMICSIYFTMQSAIFTEFFQDWFLPYIALFAVWLRPKIEGWHNTVIALIVLCHLPNFLSVYAE